MLLLDGHRQLLSDPAHQKEKVGDFAVHRKKSLHEKLGPVEKLVRQYSPLPITYDIGRLQLPYFSEFTYTDTLDAVYVTPQSVEVAAIMAQRALDDDTNERYDFNKSFEYGRNELGTFDKYNLNLETGEIPEKVVFPPGSNLFYKMVSKENLFRLMYEDQEVMIKPHPLSNYDLLRKLGRDFGYHRLIGQNSSGYKVLNKVKVMWGTTASEMPIRAALLGKQIYNIGNFFEEQIGSHTPVCRLLFNKSGEEAKTRATRILGSPLSGFFWPEDPNLEENIKFYFSEVMNQRNKHKTTMYVMPDHVKLEMWKREG